MTTITEQERLRVARFIADVETSEAVRKVLTASFLRQGSEREVHYLASSFLAVGKLEEGWRELERHRQATEQKAEGRRQPGL